jgi:hypothetical protein
MTDGRATRFTGGLAAVFGSLAQAEWSIRDARTLGLMTAGDRGHSKTWTADEIAAITATFLLTRCAKSGREEGRRMLLDPERARSVLVGVRAALWDGARIEFTLDAGRWASVTVAISADGVQRLAAMVDDWGDVREAAE